MFWIFRAHWKKIIALIAIACAILFIFGVMLVPYSGYASTSIYSTSWKGHSEMFRFFSGTERNAKVLYNFSNLQDNGILVIVSPNENVSDTPVISYLSKGGKVLIADSSDYTRNLFDSLGIERSSGPIVDKKSYYLREDAPLMEYEGGWVAFKYPFAIRCTSDDCDSKTLLQSSAVSWVDSDLDGKITTADERGPHSPAIGVKYNSTDYNLVVVGDRFVFSNDMIGEKDNEKFLSEITNMLDPTGKKEVIFYEGDKTQPNSIMDSMLNISKYASSPFLISAVFMLTFVFVYLITRVAAEVRMEEFTLYERLVSGVDRNVGKRKEPYVWLIARLQKLLDEELESVTRRGDNLSGPGTVDPESYKQAKRLAQELKGMKFEGMDVVTLERKINEVAGVISKLRSVKSKRNM